MKLNKKIVYTSALIALLFLSIFIVLIQLPTVAGVDGVNFKAPDDIPFPTITVSDDPNFLLMIDAYSAYKAYFKGNSKTSNAMMFQTQGYIFSMDISTSQLHWYNSSYNAILECSRK
jgi:hypothetical protein